MIFLAYSVKGAWKNVLVADGPDASLLQTIVYELLVCVNRITSPHTCESLSTTKHQVP